MRIDDVNLGVDTDGKTGKVRAAVISFENRDQETGERVGGQFAITLDEYAQIQAGDLTPQAIAERKLIELLAIKPEDDVTAAFVELSEQLTQDAHNLAVTAATEVASAAVEEVKVQAVQAATQVADTQTAMLRTAMRKFVQIDELEPEDIADLVGLYDPWIADEAVAVGDIRSYEGKLYKVIQAHTTQADWTPDATPALWIEIAPPVTEDGEEIVPLCHTVTGAHDVYALGQMCKETDGIVYRSTVDNNAYRPKDYPDHWEQVEDTTEPKEPEEPEDPEEPETPTEPEDPEEPEEPTEPEDPEEPEEPEEPEDPEEPTEPEEPEEPSEPDVPDFVQPTGAHDAYKTGDRVLFEGKIYESVIDANTWSPSDYPQGWKEVTE